MTTDDQIRELQRQVAEADEARRHAQEVSSELVKDKRALTTAFQSLLNVIDDSHDEDLPVEILEARDEGYRAIAIKRGAPQDHLPDASNMVPSETIASVTAWANETFGQAEIGVQIQRAAKEFDELLDIPLRVDEEARIKLAEEAADVVICLYRVIGTLDPEAINKKMAKNRARKWKVDGQGCAQHVGDE